MFAVVAVKFCFYPPIERYSCCTDIFVFEAAISLITNYSTHSILAVRIIAPRVIYIDKCAS